MTPPGSPAMVIGVGNVWRGDDAAGLEVVRRLRRLAPPPEVTVIEQEGEPASLLDAWQGADRVLVVDGVSSGSPPGKIHRFEAGEGPLPAQFFRSSTHLLGLAEAVELARELDRLPGSLAVYGIEAKCFDPGEELSPAVRSAVERLATEIRDELRGSEADGGRRAPSGAGA